MERADRVARHLRVSEVILDPFKRAVWVVTADGADLTGYDDDLARTLTRQVLAAVSHVDSLPDGLEDQIQPDISGDSLSQKA
jgi:hypothetical protein